MHSSSKSWVGRRVDLARQQPFRIGGLRVDPTLCRVWSKNTYRLEPRVMQVLVVLAEHSPNVVSRDILLEQCWDGRIVGEDAINRVVSRLRKLSGADGIERFRIETLKKVGFRLIGRIERPIVTEALPIDRAHGPETTAARGTSGGSPAIAVLPFDHDPADLDQTVLAEGVAEEIIADLSHTPLLRVISPLSSLTYRVGTGGARQACADLGVRYLVHGKVRRTSDQLRLLVTLTDGQSDETIWSARYVRPITDLLAVQGGVAAGVAGAIGPAILTHEQLQSRDRTTNMDFWELFIRARFHFWKGTLSDFEEAHALLERALALRPEDSSALSLMAMVDLSKLWSGSQPAPDLLLRQAQSNALRAIASDNRCPVAHHVMGIVLAQLGEHERAVAAQRQSLQLNPNNAQAMGELARLMAFGGDDVDAVLSLADTALALSPTDPHDWLWLRSKAIALFLSGRHIEALEAAHAACVRRPDYFFLHFLVAACAAAAGQFETAGAACEQGMAMAPAYDIHGLRLGHPFAQARDFERFREALELAGWVQAPLQEERA
jgi:TolB-like protein/Flp pilus assembly protein TadD